MEKAYIFWVLTNTNWQKQLAAKTMGIDITTLYRKIEKYNLKQFEHKGEEYIK
ncbi:MAG: helix-turn-helix domain-containing protein [bacterium]